MRRTLFFGCLCLVLEVSGQDIQVEDRYDEVFGKKPTVYSAFRSMLFSEDVSLGMEAGVALAQREVLFHLSFDARPYRKRVLRYIGNNTFYQNLEERYYIGLGGQYLKSFARNKGLFVLLEGGYTWGVFGGTELKPDKGLILLPATGFFWKINGKYPLRLGYAYFDNKTADIERHRAFLSIGVIIGKP